MIYAGDPKQQLPYLAFILTEQLCNGARCLYLNSPTMLDALRAELAIAGIDADREVSKGTLTLSSDQSYLIEGHFHPQLMLRGLASFIARAHADGYEKVWCSGDMTYELGPHASLVQLLDYERALERMFQLHPSLTGVCQYHRDTLPTSALRDALSTHQSVYLNQTLFRLNPYLPPHGTTPGESHIPTDLRDLIERFSQHQ
jgi:hypothetical protein